MDRQRRSYSNRIRTAPREQLDAQRREFLNLANAEPNLGYPVPTGDPSSQPSPELDHVLVGREDGIKEWSQRPVGLKIDGELSQILNKHRFDSGFIPTLEDLRFGEILINAYDAKLFIRTLIDGNEGIAEIETGVQGIQGPQGVQGIQGERMPFIPVDVVGSVPNVNGVFPSDPEGGPNDPQGALDYYFPDAEIGNAVFDETTSNLWVWVGTTWLNTGMLRGPQGVQGIIGPQGIQGRVGSQGFVGLQGTKGPIGSQGARGLQGLQGLQGSIGRSLRLLGTLNEVNEIPQYPQATIETEVGDAYIILDNGNIYIWDGSVWIDGGRILIQGTQGTQGVQGSRGIQGTGGFGARILGVYNDPDTPLTISYLQAEYPIADPFSLVIDISSGNGELWQTSGAGVWTKIGLVSIQGIQGLQGPQSVQGIQGLRGSQGLQGIQGQVGKPLKIIGTYNDLNEPISSELLNDLFPEAEAFDSVVDNSLGNSFLWVKNELGVWEEIGLIGVQGVQGIQGTQGLQGLQGIQGGQGDPGLQGSVGIQGIQGLQGLQGLQGIQGDLGLQGSMGSQGVQGIQGILGTQGTQGVFGGVGNQGIQGTQGLQGLLGIQGTQGVFGGVGNQGIQGTQGLQGIQGLSGGVGSLGPQGTQGIQGLLGIQGTQGVFGGVGNQGIQGPQGPQGLQGLSGGVGSLGPQGTQGIQGLLGIQGTQGLSGGVGSLGPQGTQGIQGLLGIQGASGVLGSDGSQGTQGIQGLQGLSGGVGGLGPQGIQGIQGLLGIQGLSGVETNVVTTNANGLAPATSFATIAYAAIVGLDMGALNGQYRKIGLTGNLTLTTTNRAAGRMVALRLDADGTDRALTFPAGWEFLSSRPSVLKANETAVLSLTFYGANDTDCIAAYAVTNSAITSTSTLQLAGLGLGIAPVNGWELVSGGGMCELRSVITAVSGVYTLDVTAANEFKTDVFINTATTINLSNLASIPTGYVWRGVFSFFYSSGVVSWFTGNTGYTVKWDGGTAMTLTANETEKVVIEVVGGTTVIDIAPLKGRA